MTESGGMAAHLLHQFGYAGLAVGLFLNCLGIPIAAEVLLPLAGALTRSGGLNFWLVVTVAAIAQMLGLVAAYWLARHDGSTLLERYGHYVFISHARLRKLRQLFDRRGFRLVATGLYLPGVHGYMGYVAGLGKMRLAIFLVLVITSNIVWTAGLVGLGALLSNQLGDITRTLNIAGAVLVAVFLLTGLGIWYSRHHHK